MRRFASGIAALKADTKLLTAFKAANRVMSKLAKDYDEIREVCRRHGIEISATRVRKVVRHFSAEREKTRAWRRILEQTTGALLRQSDA